MLPTARRANLLSALKASGVLSTDVLAECLGVSDETIRRDMVLLEREGRLVRVHGGAMSLDDARVTATVEPFHTRQQEGREAKSRIGAAAAGLLKNGDIVAIDAGTTALQVARALPKDFAGVVATPSLLVAAELAGRPNLDVLVSGGSVRAGDLMCSDAQALAFFGDICIDIAFLSSGGISSDQGVTDFYREEVPVRRAILKQSKRSFIVADSDKMGKVAPYRVCNLEDVGGLITDAPPPHTLGQRLGELGWELLLS